MENLKKKELPASSPNRNKYKQKLQQKRFVTKLINRALWGIKDVWKTWPWSTLKVISWNWLERLRETTVIAATTLAIIYKKYHLHNSDVLTEHPIQRVPGGKAAGVYLCRHLTTSVPPLSKRYERLICLNLRCSIPKCLWNKRWDLFLSQWWKTKVGGGTKNEKTTPEHYKLIIIIIIIISSSSSSSISISIIARGTNYFLITYW